MTVHRITPIRIPRATIKCTEKLFKLAAAAKLTGIAFVAYTGKDGQFIADACGDAHNQPERTIEMLGFLEERLRKRKGIG